tara:strand:+ start:516 stop:1820 length:1305 start_codon:yes stop_codon:yes gene_type:complete
MKMKVKIRIRQPGTGSANYNQTSFLLKHNQKGSDSIGTVNKYGEMVVTSERGNYTYGTKDEDPVFESLSKTLDKMLFIRYGQVKLDEFMFMLTYRYPDGNVMLMGLKESGFTLNGRKMSKAVMLSILSRVVYRSCFCDSAIILNSYIQSLMEVPPNVRYAIENKCPYYFYPPNETNPYRRSKVEVRLSVKRISKTHCAMELSENIWASIGIKELDQFLNVYRRNKRQSKRWVDINPHNLWMELFGQIPSDSEHKMMVAWMLQNRTDKMIEDTAKGLMWEVARENDNINTFYFGKKQEDGKFVKGTRKLGMLVNGQLCDWVLIENAAAKTSPQRVSIYCFHEDPERIEKTTTNIAKKKFLNGELHGPICVNNSVGNVSLGDQFVSRVFTLMNDRLALKKVGTLRGYIPSDALSGKSHRINMKSYAKWTSGKGKKK